MSPSLTYRFPFAYRRSLVDDVLKERRNAVYKHRDARASRAMQLHSSYRALMLREGLRCRPVCVVYIK